MNLPDFLAVTPPDWTPEWVSDRGIAWIKTCSEIAMAAISALVPIVGAAYALAFLVKKNEAQLHQKEMDAKLANTEARLDRQGTKIENNSQAITAVALATPIIPPGVQKVEVTNPPEKPVPVTEPERA